MAKFISFTKLVDSTSLIINMDSVNNMMPVKKLYNGNMIDCTDIYYEDHRITVIADMNSIMETLYSMGESGAEDMSLNHDELDPNSQAYEDMEGDDLEYVTINITGFRKDPEDSPDEEHHIIFLSYQYNQKPFGEDIDANFTKSLQIPEGQNYVYVVYLNSYNDNSQWVGWYMKDSSNNVCVFATEEDAQEYIYNGDINLLQGLYSISDPIKVPLDVAFDLLNDHYDDFDLPISMIYSMYEIVKNNVFYKDNDPYITFSKSNIGAQNMLPNYPSNKLVGETTYSRSFPVTPVAEENHDYYVVLKVNYKRLSDGFSSRRIHTAYPVNIFSYESDAQEYLHQHNAGLDYTSAGFYYYCYSINLEHLYYYTSGGTGSGKILKMIN